jgi:DNA-binding response OmpR family regulator
MPDESVLVVDDSPTILKLVQLVLTKAGYRVAAASSGEAGLLAAHEEPPSLILLDYLMPEMNGDDVCRAMSADTVLCNVPVVVMSAREDEVGERFARMPNVVDQMTKPFSSEALLAVIAHTLAKQERKRAPDATRAATPALGLHSLPRVDDGVAATTPAAQAAAAAEVATAALAGDLAVISIADVLTLLQDQAQTGTLTLSQPEVGPDQTGTAGSPHFAQARLDVFLRNGRIDFAAARGVPEEFLLGRFLVEGGQLAAGALSAVIDDRKAVGGKPPLLGEDLVARGLVTPPGLRRAMSQQTSALVYEGLRWGSGRFVFHSEAELPDPAREAALALPVDALIMEGLRRVDEWRLIEREIGDFEMVFVRNEEKLATFGRGKLLRDEVAVLEFVNGKNSVKDIIYLAKMGSFDVTKMLYRLLRNKLIRRRVSPIAV